MISCSSNPVQLNRFTHSQPVSLFLDFPDPSSLDPSTRQSLTVTNPTPSLYEYFVHTSSAAAFSATPASDAVAAAAVAAAVAVCPRAPRCSSAIRHHRWLSPGDAVPVPSRVVICARRSLSRPHPHANPPNPHRCRCTSSHSAAPEPDQAWLSLTGPQTAAVAGAPVVHD